MFKLLTGRVVHVADTLNEQLLAAMTPAPPIGTLAPTVPIPVVEVVDKARLQRKGRSLGRCAQHAAGHARSAGPLPEKRPPRSCRSTTTVSWLMPPPWLLSKVPHRSPRRTTPPRSGRGGRAGAHGSGGSSRWSPSARPVTSSCREARWTCRRRSSSTATAACSETRRSRSRAPSRGSSRHCPPPPPPVNRPCRAAPKRRRRSTPELRAPRPRARRQRAPSRPARTRRVASKHRHGGRFWRRDSERVFPSTAMPPFTASAPPAPAPRAAPAPAPEPKATAVRKPPPPKKRTHHRRRP